MRFLKGRETGFTLIELLVAVPILAIVMLGATMAIIQLVQAGNNSNHMSAVRHVQDAGFWVSRDSVQAQIITDNNTSTLTIDVDDPASNQTEILILEWTEWATDEEHRVVYSLVDMPSGGVHQLQRYHTTNSTNPTTIIVAEFIDGSVTECEWTGDDHRSFYFKVTATVANRTEYREYEIRPRPLAY
jgi:prepilin-type N-terminal cleavage/methylation domain-containing protein